MCPKGMLTVRYSSNQCNLYIICLYVQIVMHEEDETVDVEGDSELEEWHESQRRRTNQLVSGMSQNSNRTTDIDNDGDVIVDGDEPEEGGFGPSQYTEDDVIIKQNKEAMEGVQSQVSNIKL